MKFYNLGHKTFETDFSYVARSGHGMLVITLIYLLQFVKKLQEPLLYPTLSSSTGDNLMILLIG